MEFRVGEACAIPYPDGFFDAGRCERVFLYVPDRLAAIQEMRRVLKPGGRVAVITFHSIEDRIVKIFFRDNTFEAQDENPFDNTEKQKVLRAVNKKPVVATAEETKINPRARSAKLRVAEKINELDL